MARFRFDCTDCGEFYKSLDKRSRSCTCPVCRKDAKNIIGAGTTQIMERLDNGLMGRAVERLHNVEEILNDLADKDQLPQDMPNDDEDT
jgi:hypothetical protein